MRHRAPDQRVQPKVGPGVALAADPGVSCRLLGDHRSKWLVVSMLHGGHAVALKVHSVKRMVWSDNEDGACQPKGLKRQAIF